MPKKKKKGEGWGEGLAGEVKDEAYRRRESGSSPEKP
nr:hypothetical protein Iba_chr02bCG8680 [Ipomoea batatas]GMC74089.1 hypothetical protein Iba_chr03cCG6950 [Ipomoea batatas]